MSAHKLPSSPMMRALAAAVLADVPTLIWGSPGTTKTAKLTNHFTTWGYLTKVIIGGIREATDFLGQPTTKEGVEGTFYEPPKWALELNEAPKGVAVFDEFTVGGSVMKAMLRTIQEREVGELTLHPGIRIVAIANPVDESVDGIELAPPIANRFLHLDWVFDANEWLTGVATDFQNVAVPSLSSLTAPGNADDRAYAVSVVTTFLNQHPSFLHGADAGVPKDFTQAGGPWPSPRSWTNVIDTLTFVRRDDEDTRDLVLAGLVGKGAQRAFTAWLEAFDLHDPQAVLNDPSIVSWTQDRPDRLFALMQSITTLVTANAHDAQVWGQAVEAFLACAEAGRPDVALPGTATVCNAIPKGATVPRARLRAAFDAALLPV